eukprot:GHVS01031644.1.p1 GENE.GHVS01031644.1~~GHVS01031644.1.p1  ORF type:complete len:149 (+),score=33.32 GHVS01031644.1:294-740(+)
MAGSCCNIVVFLAGFVVASIQSLHALTSPSNLSQMHRSLQYFLLLTVSMFLIFPVLDPLLCLLPYHLWFLLKLFSVLLLAMTNRPYTSRVFDLVEKNYEDYGRVVFELLEEKAINPFREGVQCVLHKVKGTTTTTDKTTSGAGCCVGR